jgi:smad nuclear-interacting protein 1
VVLVSLRSLDADWDPHPAVLAVHRQSVYLFGRDAAVSTPFKFNDDLRRSSLQVVDIPLDHPSCSKQHAALQYRHVMEKNEFGEKRGVVKPFIIDLESTNGTHVNDEQIPSARYYELKLNDGEFDFMDVYVNY